MKNFIIKNHLEETVSILTNKTIQDVQDVIYDLREYHGFNLNYTYEEIIT
jgi:hypothetical protein|tara:strand:- start:302 stop:451 length:150 start_codon:yes stop_codon:yes gene_type:complete